jgi:hypothetical protein
MNPQITRLPEVIALPYRARDRQTWPMVDTSGQGERWWLITQLPPLKAGSKADLTIVRQLSDEELNTARKANGLLNRLASAAPYARLVEVFAEVLASLSDRSTAERKAAELNRAVRALGRIGAALADDLRGSARDDFGESDEFSALDAAIREECGRAPFQLLVAVGGLSEGPFAPVEGGVENDLEAIAALQASVPEVTPAVDLISTLRAGVVIAQRLIGRQLEIYRDRIEESALYLRRLAAEVPDGAAALMRADQLDPASGTLNLGKISVDPLALDSAVVLHRALRHSQALLVETNELTVPATPEVTPPTSDARTERDDEAAPEIEAVSPDQAESAGGRSSDRETAERERNRQSEAPEPPPGGRADQVLDLEALAQHVTELTVELERAWSAALEPAAMADAQSEMGARLSSLLHSIQRRVAAGDRALKESGRDTQISEYPLPASAMTELTFTPDAERRWRQYQLAELEALTGLLEAVKGLQAPSAHRITLSTGHVESWWEAGAFDLVRARVRLLARVSVAASSAEAVLQGRSAVDSRALDFFDQLRLASEALSHGDPEGALVHGFAALRQRAALAAGPVPDDLLDRLASDPRLATEAPLLRLMREAAATLGSGEGLDVGASVLVAPRALALLGRLRLEEPQILEEALRIDADDS